MRTRTVIILGLLMAVLGSVVSHLYFSRPASTDQLVAKTEMEAVEIETGTARPAFSLPDIDGEIHDVGEWDGKVLVLNFWATWCPPCRDEIPEFVHLQEKYASKGVQFVGIAPEEADPVRDFAAEFQINYPLLIGRGDVIRISEDYGNTIGALPYTVIVNRNGRIAHMQRGPLAGEKAESIIRSLL